MNMTDEELDAWLKRAGEGQRAIARQFAKTIDRAFWDTVLTYRKAGLPLMEAVNAAMDALNKC